MQIPFARVSGLPIAGTGILLVAFALATFSTHATPPLTQPTDAYGELPLSFVPNAGQADERVRFAAQGSGFSFQFTERGVALAFTKGKRGVGLHLTPLGADPRARVEGFDQLPGKVNYFTGSRSHANIPTYGALSYRQLWPGIDMVFRGQGGALKYEFHVRPGADPGRIRLAYRGAEGIEVAPAGHLRIATPLGTLSDARPRTYQMENGKRVDVASRYSLHGGNSYGFGLGASYDPDRSLVIDPGLTYSTFLGGTGDDVGEAIAVDSSGNAYVAGYASPSLYPVTVGAFDVGHNGMFDAIITKMNAAGSNLVYSTFLGGASNDMANGIAVDASGNAHVVGVTFSTAFPTTAGAFDTTLSGTSDAFAVKLNAAGSALTYSTYLGGTNRDHAAAIALDPTGRAYVAGGANSTDFPTTSNTVDDTYAGNQDAFVTRLTAAGALSYSTFLGGGAEDNATAIDSGTSGIAYVAGETSSSGFPVTGTAFDTSWNLGSDAFVSKINSLGTNLTYSTFLGGSGTDIAEGLVLDASENAYVVGQTTAGSTNLFPTTAGSFDPTPGGTDGFVSRLNTLGSTLVYSTFIGGAGNDHANAVSLDGTGSAYVAGQTASPDFPVSAGASDESHNGGQDVFVSRLNPTGSVVTHSTFLGGGASDFGRGIAQQGSAAYVAGETRTPIAPAFPTTSGAFDTSQNGMADAFAAKLDMGASPGFVRPQSAAPTRVSLVPAFVACSSPNRVHGPPDLPGGTNPDGSCNPPAQESSFVTIGTPDANTKQANAAGSVKVSVTVGNPVTTADEADVSLTATMTDVRNSGSLTDYTGELLAELDLQVTDRFNGPTKNDPATGQGVILPVKLTCTATPGPQDLGATCSANTTADAVSPALVREGVRSVWQLGAIEVFDGGADGDADTTPNTGFARQGVFIP